MTADLEFERECSHKAIERGEHIPKAWEIGFDTGDDGCMPRGFYLWGVCSLGLPITFPVRHEYGPFKTEASARQFITSTPWANLPVTVREASL